MTAKPVPGQGANGVIHRQQIANALNTLIQQVNTLTTTTASALATINTALALVATSQFPKVRAHQAASAQSIANSTATKVTFDAEDFDTNSNFASSTFTPTIAGTYRVSAVVTFASAITSVNIKILKGSTVVSQWDAGAVVQSVMISDLVQCDGSVDAITVEITQVSGGAVSLVNNGTLTYFAAERVP